MFLNKYGVARHIYIPVVKRGVVDFAVGADWTPAAGDVKISKDGGAAANVTNLPTAIAMGNGAIWDFSLTATEMQAAQVVVTVADSSTKAVEDQSFIIQTHGNASAQFQIDLADSVRAGLTALPNATVSGVGGLLTAPTTANVGLADLSRILGTALTETAGQIAAGFKKLFDVAAPVFTLLSVNQTGDSYGRLGAPAGASVSADVAAVKVDTAAVKVQTDKLTFTVANQVDSNVLDWKSATAPAMTGDAFARLGAPVGASISADIAGVQSDTDNLQTRIPAALGANGNIKADIRDYNGSAGTFASGRPEVNTTHFAGTAITSAAGIPEVKVASIAANAITASAIAADAIGASELAADAALEIADAILARDLGSGTGAGSSEERTVRSALRFLRNKFSFSGSTMTVTKEDDATAAWTSVVATDALADPIVGSDPT